MSTILRLIQEARSHPNCKVYPASGLPKLRSHILPPDLKEFFEECGGMLLFGNSEFPYRVLPPMEFRLANLEILGEEVEDDISNDWYTIVEDGDGEISGDFITIDLHSKRLGRCYDSFHETHGLIGETPIIAFSFTELLQQLLHNMGKQIYWLDENFNALGDAYDNQLLS